MRPPRPRPSAIQVRVALASIVATSAVGRADETLEAPALTAEPFKAVEPVTPDPLTGTADVSPAVTGSDPIVGMGGLLPPRTDSPFDWHAGLEPLHHCGEPRALSPCVPPPPCHPSEPPCPADLVGKTGVPSCGPIYRGPCNPRTGSRDGTHFSWLHRMQDRFFDAFYRSP